MKKLGFVLAALVAVFTISSTTPASAGGKEIVDGIVLGHAKDMSVELDKKRYGAKTLTKSDHVEIFCTSILRGPYEDEAISGILVIDEYRSNTTGPANQEKETVVYSDARIVISYCGFYSCRYDYEPADAESAKYENGIFTISSSRHTLVCTEPDAGYLYESENHGRWWNNAGSSGMNKTSYSYAEVETAGVSHRPIYKGYLHEYMQINVGLAHYKHQSDGSGGKGGKTDEIEAVQLDGRGNKDHGKGNSGKK